MYNLTGISFCLLQPCSYFKLESLGFRWLKVKLLPEMLIMQELKNIFSYSDFGIVKKHSSCSFLEEMAISFNLRLPIGLEMQVVLTG